MSQKLRLAHEAVHKLNGVLNWVAEDLSGVQVELRERAVLCLNSVDFHTDAANKLATEICDKLTTTSVDVTKLLHRYDVHRNLAKQAGESRDRITLLVQKLATINMHAQQGVIPECLYK